MGDYPGAKLLKILKNQRRLIMIEQDTIRLLRECDAGIKMGISAIDEVMKYVKN